MGGLHAGVSIPIRFNYNTAAWVTELIKSAVSIPIRFNYNEKGGVEYPNFIGVSIPIRFNYNTVQQNLSKLARLVQFQ